MLSMKTRGLALLDTIDISLSEAWLGVRLNVFRTSGALLIHDALWGRITSILSRFGILLRCELVNKNPGGVAFEPLYAEFSGMFRWFARFLLSFLNLDLRF
jgi:hypothetical protein